MSEAQAIAPEEAETPKSENALLLDSLEIENFRCFRHLTIPKLGRVNLITGKNNVGKSTLLEAIWLLGMRGRSSSIFDLLRYRKQDESFSPGQEKLAFDHLKVLWNDPHYMDGKLVIGNSKLNIVVERSIVKDEHFDKGIISIHSGDMFDDVTESGFFHYYYTDDYEYPEFKFFRPGEITDHYLLGVWKKIEFSEKEEFILEAIKIIEPNAVRIGFKWEKNYPVIRTKFNPEAVPARVFGDGLNHILGIATVLSLSKDTVLCLDEVENGIHYSVLKDLWRLIFKTAHDLNIQIFCTTHSWECIEAFQQVASEDDDPNSGMLIRLQNRDGDIVATNFDEDGLEVMTRHGLEVR